MKDNKLTEDENKLLLKFGYTQKNIDYIVDNATRENVEEILSRAKKHNAEMMKLNQHYKLESRQLKKQKRLIESQAKHNAGAVVLDYLIDRNVISDYSSILIQGTNTLTEDFQATLKKIFTFLDEKEL